MRAALGYVILRLGTTVSKFGQDVGCTGPQVLYVSLNRPEARDVRPNDSITQASSQVDGENILLHAPGSATDNDGEMNPSADFQAYQLSS